MRKYIIGILLLISWISYSQSYQAKGRATIYEFATDTVTNTDNSTFTFPQTIEEKRTYSVQIAADQLSGTSAGYAILQQSNSTSGDVYTPIDTVTISGTTNGILYGSLFYGAKLRLYVTTSGTHSTKLRCWMVLKDD